MTKKLTTFINWQILQNNRKILHTYTWEGWYMPKWLYYLLQTKNFPLFWSHAWKYKKRLTKAGTILGRKCIQLVSATFYQIFIFSQNDSPLKLWKMFFISSKKFFSFSRYSNFCIFFPSFHNFQIQKDKWKWNNLCRVPNSDSRFAFRDFFSSFHKSGFRNRLSQSRLDTCWRRRVWYQKFLSCSGN